MIGNIQIDKQKKNLVVALIHLIKRAHLRWWTVKATYPHLINARRSPNPNEKFNEIESRNHCKDSNFWTLIIISVSCLYHGQDEVDAGQSPTKHCRYDRKTLERTSLGIKQDHSDIHLTSWIIKTAFRAARALFASHGKCCLSCSLG